MYFIQHCFICRPSDSNVSEDARSNPGLLRLRHWQSAVRHSKQLGQMSSTDHDTHISSQDTFCSSILCRFSRIDSYTLIHIFKSIHAHIDTPVHHMYRLIQSYIDTHIQLSRYILFLHSLPITIGLIPIHGFINSSRYTHT